MINREVGLVKSLRPNLNGYVYHTSLNFAKEDILDNEQLLAIAQDYLRESGYTNKRFCVVRALTVSVMLLSMQIQVLSGRPDC
jgi:hypothetical protein